ncbi:MAG: hypothetical protein MZV70_08780 [Desulfobacterales bacterium]|nr:hypothetical protein [Desulfobacterales bacterium]
MAVVDSGVLLNHPDLQGRLAAGFDFIRNPDIAGDADGIDSNPDDPGDQDAGRQHLSRHACRRHRSLRRPTTPQGVAGVTQATQIMPLRVLGIGGLGTEYDRAAGGALCRRARRTTPAPCRRKRPPSSI